MNLEQEITLTKRATAIGLLVLFLLILSISVHAEFNCTNSTVCYENNINVTFVSSIENNVSVVQILYNNFTISLFNNITNIFNPVNNVNVTVTNSNTNVNQNNVTVNINNTNTIINQNNLTVDIQNNVTNIFNPSNNVNISIWNNVTSFFTNQYNFTINQGNIDIDNDIEFNYTSRDTINCPSLPNIPSCPAIPACPTPNINITNQFMFPQDVTLAKKTTTPGSDPYAIWVVLIGLGLLWYFKIYKKGREEPPKEPPQEVKKFADFEPYRNAYDAAEAQEASESYYGFSKDERGWK